MFFTLLIICILSIIVSINAEERLPLIPADIKVQGDTVIITSPPLSAYIYINGKFVSQSPSPPIKLPPGTHTIKLTFNGYADYVTQVKPNIRANVVPEGDSVIINSRPQITDIYLDGAQTGKQTPATLRDLSDGMHIITLSCRGYSSYNETITIIKPSIKRDIIVESDSIIIKTEPERADVYLDDIPKGKTPLLLKKIQVKEHSLRITYPHYKTFDTLINILESSIEGSIEFDCDSAVVKSTPEGKDIYLDGIYIAKTPRTIRKIPLGPHIIKITHPGCSDYIKTIDVIEKSIDAIFTIERNNLTITTDPKGCKIYLDTIYKKTTPITLKKLPIGNYNIKLIYPGYRPYIKRVVIEWPKIEAIISVIGDTAIISAIPKKVNVSLNGESRGTTPMYLYLPSGLNRINLNLPGYMSFDTMIPIRILSIPHTFFLQNNNLRIQTDPSGIKVIWDGIEVGNTPYLKNNLSEGQYSIKLKYPGYYDFDTIIVVKLPKPIKPLDTITLTYLRKNSSGYDEYLHNKTGIVLIKIPRTVFMMGTNDGDKDERPPHQVCLDTFYIGKYEVTNSQYKKFCDENGRPYPKDPDFFGMPNYIKNYPNYPVVNIAWEDAKAFCDWAGLRLPTEAEWELAAKGPNNRKYPWGNEEPDFNGINRCNYAGKTKDSFSFTCPIDYYANGQSYYGCYNMAGNVWEWCSDWYDENYYSKSPNNNPSGPKPSFRLGFLIGRGCCLVLFYPRLWNHPFNVAHVRRGGSYLSRAIDCRTTNRDGFIPSNQYNCYGFRVALTK